MDNFRLSVSAEAHNKMLSRMRGDIDRNIERVTNPYFQQSGEEFWPPEDATQFSYNSQSERWDVHPIKLRIAKNEFARGGMRAVYRAGVINDDGTVFPCVVKVFKKEQQNPKVVFHEALTQSVAQSYAEAFNRVLEGRKQSQEYQINFLPVNVLQLHARGAQYFATMERFLEYPDSYIKLNDNQGRVLKSAAGDLAQTFSYFTFVVSKGMLVVCDIQGVRNTYTDPQIHSSDGHLFGAGNLGEEGISRFLASFRYTKLCSKLKLPKPAKDLSSTRTIVAKLKDSVVRPELISHPEHRRAQSHASVIEGAAFGYPGHSAASYNIGGNMSSAFVAPRPPPSPVVELDDPGITVESMSADTKRLSRPRSLGAALSRSLGLIRLSSKPSAGGLKREPSAASMRAGQQQTERPEGRLSKGPPTLMEIRDALQSEANLLGDSVTLVAESTVEYNLYHLV